MQHQLSLHLLHVVGHLPEDGLPHQLGVVHGVRHRQQDHVPVLLARRPRHERLERLDDGLAVLGRAVPRAQHGGARAVVRVQDVDAHVAEGLDAL